MPKVRRKKLSNFLCVCISCSSTLECYFFSKILKFIFQFIWKAEGGRGYRQAKRDHPSIYWFPAQIPVMATAGHQICLFMEEKYKGKYISYTHTDIFTQNFKKEVKKKTQSKKPSTLWDSSHWHLLSFYFACREQLKYCKTISAVICVNFSLKETMFQYDRKNHLN